MTNEEALEVCKMAIKTFSVKNGTFGNEDGVKQFVERMRERYDIEVMVKALEKQIPKKPKITFNWTEPSLPVVRCPECVEPLLGCKVYCSNCGQKLLDWSD